MPDLDELEDIDPDHAGALQLMHAAFAEQLASTGRPAFGARMQQLVALEANPGEPTDPVLVSDRFPTLKTFKDDLDAAKIPYKDEKGRVANFHAVCRTTLATSLSGAGVHPRVAQEILRHSEIELTMQTYTDAGKLDMREAVERLRPTPPATPAPHPNPRRRSRPRGQCLQTCLQTRPTRRPILLHLRAHQSGRQQGSRRALKTLEVQAGKRDRKWYAPQDLNL